MKYLPKFRHFYLFWGQDIGQGEGLTQRSTDPVSEGRSEASSEASSVDPLDDEPCFIHGDMNLLDVLEMDANLIDVFYEFGLMCISCMLSQYETVNQAAAVHGLDEVELVQALNAKYNADLRAFMDQEGQDVGSDASTQA